MIEQIRRFVSRARAQLSAALGTARENPRQAAAATGAFLGRWVLRIGLPLAGAAAMLTLLPYRATAAGAHFRIQGSLLTRRSLSADTSFGSWTFPHFDALPVGVHVAPVDVDLVRVAAKANADPQGYAARLRADLVHQLPGIVAWLVADVLVGVLLGLTVAAAINLAIRQLRGLPRREHEARHRVRQLAAAGSVLAIVAAVGALTYEPAWARQSRVSGTLATLQLFPDQLRTYYNQHAKALDVLSAVSAIQSGLQHQVEETEVPATAFNIMFISDMHLASTYPLVAQYARNFDVKLIINSGDEAEFGARAELTPTYLQQLRAVAKIAPMIWVAGNHDSPDTVATIRSIPGVIVLGSKARTLDGDGYRVTGQELTAYGLIVAGMPDPRVYGGVGEFGAEKDAQVNPLEQRAVDAAVSRIPPDQRFDIFAAHEPVAVAELVKKLPGQIRQTNAGHLHAQNPDEQTQQQGKPISLVEGSTGAGGLDQLNRGLPPSPTEFSIESVAADCQFTKLVRFQITGAAPTSASQITAGELPQVTASTRYLKPQDISDSRVCNTALGMSGTINLSN